MNHNSKPTVVVAMSGGVDSSMAAALLVEQGYHVIGMMLRLWSEQGSEQANRCCTPDSVAQARRIASILSIPFYVLDAKQLFFDAVVQPFIDDYTQNKTPNPCIRCNRLVRWTFLYQHALASGADFLATGHYARTETTQQHTMLLRRGVDNSKDQSYVLHVLTQAQLHHALFPLGDYLKSEVRELARKYNLPVADRPDSQDLCFLGRDGDYRSFLKQHAPEAILPGPILDPQGKVLGQHPGLAFYTIGQRKGIQVAGGGPLYVLDKDLSTRSLVVGPRDGLGKDDLAADGMNWIEGQPPAERFRASIKIRYKSQDFPCSVQIENASRVNVKFDNLVRDITPGQAAVLYNGDICLGGGIITGQAG